MDRMPQEWAHGRGPNGVVRFGDVAVDYVGTKGGVEIGILQAKQPWKLRWAGRSQIEKVHSPLD